MSGTSPSLSTHLRSMPHPDDEDDDDDDHDVSDGEDDDRCSHPFSTMMRIIS